MGGQRHAPAALPPGKTNIGICLNCVELRNFYCRPEDETRLPEVFIALCQNRPCSRDLDTYTKIFYKFLWRFLSHVAEDAIFVRDRSLLCTKIHGMLDAFVSKDVASFRNPLLH